MVVVGRPVPHTYFTQGINLLKTIPREEIYDTEVYPLPIISRAEWGALPPKAPGEAVPLPNTHLRFTDTDTEQCTSREECIPLLQKIQKDHMEKEGLNDIKYNFMIDSEGQIYEGRGWGIEADRPDVEYNKDLIIIKGKSVDFAYIGTFDGTMTVEVPDKMLASAFHYTHWASRHDLLANAFSITQLRIPNGGSA